MNMNNDIFPGLDEILKQMQKDDLKQKAANKHKNGVTCSKCGDFNEYITEPNQDDGTHLCYKCRRF